jgi:hypothetical protein
MGVTSLVENFAVLAVTIDSWPSNLPSAIAPKDDTRSDHHK